MSESTEVIDATEAEPAPPVDVTAAAGDEALAAEVVHLPARIDTPMVPGLDMPIVPAREEMRGLAEMAVTLCQARALPDALRDKPADVFLILLTARDLAVSLTTALREFHVIDGKVTTSPKVRMAMVRQQGIGRIWPHQGPRPLVDPETGAQKLAADGEPMWRLCECGNEHGDNDADAATWHAERADQPGTIFSSTFTHAMASAIIVKGNDTLADKNNWRNYPDRMCSWRSLGYLMDDAFPEVGTGLYSPDEMGAVTDEEGLPVIDLDQTTPLVGQRHKRGQRGGRARNDQGAETPANPADLIDLGKRIGVLPAAAVVVLKELWKAKELPSLADLLHRHTVIAKALVESIEKRARKGEWGEWAPPSTQDAHVAPDAPPAPSGDDPAPDATEAATGDPGVPDAPSADVDDPVAAIVEKVKHMSKITVDAELTSRAMPTTGNEAARRKRLAEVLLAESEAPFDDTPAGDAGQATLLDAGDAAKA